MKLKQKTTLMMTLLLLASAYAARTGACTSDACGYCEKSGTDTYCTVCHGRPMSGTGTNRRCQGGTEIPGCIEYKADSQGGVYCSMCDSSKNYQLLEYGDKQTNKCVLCDRSSSYLDRESGQCTVATPVTGCSKYRRFEGNCQECEIGKAPSLEIPIVCVPIMENCSINLSVENECSECTDYYYVDYSLKTCKKIPIPNCKRANIYPEVGFSVIGVCNLCDDGLNSKKDKDICKPNVMKNCKFIQEYSISENCIECMPQYVLDLNNQEQCIPVDFPSCLKPYFSENDKILKCEKCKPGFAKSTDETECVPFPTGCLAAAFDSHILKCYQCDTKASNYAVGVKGDFTFPVIDEGYRGTY